MKIEDAIEMLKNEMPNILPVSKDSKHQDDRYRCLSMGADALEKQTNPDFVEVVRCKDCKHWTKAVIGRLRGGHPCGKIHGTTEIKQADDYCSWGERLK